MLIRKTSNWQPLAMAWTNNKNMDKDKIKKLNEMLRTSLNLINNLPITEHAPHDAVKIKVILDSCLKLTETSPFRGNDFSNDFERFFKYYISLQNKKFGYDQSDPIGLYPYQKDVVENLFSNKKHNQIYIKHPRQSGITLLTTLYYIWKCIYTRNYNVVYVVPRSDHGSSVMEIINSIGLDSPFVETQNRREVKFANGSRFKIHTEFNKSAIDVQFRGHSLDVAIFDQFLWMDGFHETVQALYPCLASKNGKFIFFNSGKSWKEFINSYLGRTGDYYIFRDIKISEIPNRDVEWAVKTIENIGLEAFKTEFL